MAVLPGAAPADWRLIRTEGDVSYIHVAIASLERHRTQTDSWKRNRAGLDPFNAVVMREAAAEDRPWKVVLAAASALQGQCYCDNSEDLG
ncbi:MAG: DUF3305 domain-containing protein [Pseudomonadota bacterium]